MAVAENIRDAHVINMIQEMGTEKNAYAYLLFPSVRTVSTVRSTCHASCFADDVTLQGDDFHLAQVIEEERVSIRVLSCVVCCVVWYFIILCCAVMCCIKM